MATSDYPLSTTTSYGVSYPLDATLDTYRLPQGNRRGTNTLFESFDGILNPYVQDDYFGLNYQLGSQYSSPAYLGEWSQGVLGAMGVDQDTGLMKALDRLRKSGDPDYQRVREAIQAEQKPEAVWERDQALFDPVTPTPNQTTGPVGGSLTAPQATAAPLEWTMGPGLSNTVINPTPQQMQNFALQQTADNPYLNTGFSGQLEPLGALGEDTTKSWFTQLGDTLSDHFSKHQDTYTALGGMGQLGLGIWDAFQSMADSAFARDQARQNQARANHVLNQNIDMLNQRSVDQSRARNSATGFATHRPDKLERFNWG